MEWYKIYFLGMPFVCLYEIGMLGCEESKFPILAILFWPITAISILFKIVSFLIQFVFLIIEEFIFEIDVIKEVVLSVVKNKKK